MSALRFVGAFEGDASGNFSGSFSGDGSGLGGVDAATLNNHDGSFYQNAVNITTGTLADKRLSDNVVLSNRDNSLTGSNSFAAATLFSGSTNFSGSSSFSGDTTFTGSASFSQPVVGADALNDDEFVTKFQLDGATGGGTKVSSLNGLTDMLNLQGNAQIAVSDNGSDTISLAIQSGSIGDSQLAFNTGQNLTATSSPTFATINTGNGNLEVNTIAGFLGNQNLRTTDSPTFAGLSVNSLISQNSNNVCDASNNCSYQAAGSYEAPLTFNNGLTRTTNTVQLGGSLLQATDIALAGNNFSFSGSGNVGIGTTAPAQKLDVNGVTRLRDGLEFQPSYTGLGSYRLKVGDSTSGAEGALLLQDTLNGPYRLAVATNGNVGIGKATPAYKLDVSGGTGIVGQFSGRVIGGAALNSNEFTTKSQLDALTSGTAGAFIQNGNSFGTLATLGTNDAFGLALETGGTERLRVDTSGNVGIGVTNPAQKLEVAGTIRLTVTNVGSVDLQPTGSQALRISGTVSTKLSDYIQSYATSFYLNGLNGLTYIKSDGATAVFTVNDNGNGYFAGNVGIGTTAPAYKLDVSGGTGIVGQFSGRVIGGAALNSNEFTTKSQLDAVTGGTAGAFIQNGNSFGTLATLGTNDAFGLALETGGTERLRIDTSGNVGIGTTAPGAKLELRSDITGLEVMNLLTKLNNSSAIPTIGFDVTNGISEPRATKFGIGASRSLVNGRGALLFMANNVADGSSITTADEVLRIDSSNSVSIGTGKLGIGLGSTSPTYPLHIRNASTTDLAVETLSSGASASSRFIKPSQTWQLGIGPGNGSNGLNIYDTTAGAIRLTVLDTSGNVGIGTTAPTERLHVAGNALIAGTLTVTQPATFQGTLTVTGNATFNGNITFSANTRGKDQAVTAAATTLAITGKT